MSELLEEKAETRLNLTGIVYQEKAGIEPGNAPINIGELWLPCLDALKGVNEKRAAEAALTKSRDDDRAELEILQNETALDDPQGIAILASATTKLNLYTPHLRLAAGKTAEAADAFKTVAAGLLEPLIGEVRRKQALLREKFYAFIAPHMRGLNFNHPEYVDRGSIERLAERTFTHISLAGAENQIRNQLNIIAKSEPDQLEEALGELLGLAKKLESIKI
jgi:hypothetical protein